MAAVEMEQLRMESEQLKNRIRVSIDYFSILSYLKIFTFIAFQRALKCRDYMRPGVKSNTERRRHRLHNRLNIARPSFCRHLSSPVLNTLPASELARQMGLCVCFLSFINLGLCSFELKIDTPVTGKC